jgi:ribosomal protein S21
MSIVNIKISRNSNEQPASVIRRFQKKVQEAGILPVVRGKRYSTRELSTLKVKAAKLKKLAATKRWNKLKRLGMSVEKIKKTK